MTDGRLLYMFALLEAGMSLLAMLGGAIFMGGAWWYVGFGLLVAAVYIVAGQAASRGRRWGLVVLLVAECVRLTGFGLGAIIGAMPWVQLTVSGATLVDSLVLPVIVAVMVLLRLTRAPAPIVAPLEPTLELVA
jgi:hypothetical protein